MKVIKNCCAKCKYYSAKLVWNPPAEIERYCHLRDRFIDNELGHCEMFEEKRK